MTRENLSARRNLHPPEFNRRILLIWLLLAFFQGAAAAAIYLYLPSEGGGFLGLSPLRLALIGGILLLEVLLLVAAFRLWRRAASEDAVPMRILAWLERGRHAAWLGMISLGLLLGAVFLVLLTPEVSEPYTRALLERFVPLVLWLAGLSLQTTLLLAVYFWDAPGLMAARQNRLLRGALLLWGGFLLIWGWVAWSRVGVTVDPRGWNVPGAPVTEVHALLAWLAGLLFLAVGVWMGRSGRKPLPGRLDVVLGLLIWLAAWGYWLSVPLPASWFVDAPTEPNYEYYPNSDALIYDTTGQSVLVGEPYKSWDLPYPRRPMYAMFLAGLRGLGAQDYGLAAGLQAGVLAIFPVLIFLLAGSLGDRLAGVFAAALVILREGSGIAISGSITVAHSRLLMSDLPNAFGALLFTLIIVGWLKAPQARRGFALLGGAVLGTFMLVRPEIGVLLLAAAGVSLLVLHARLRSWAGGLALLVLGLGLVLAPWVWRNYRLSGQIFLERPGNRVDFLLKRLFKPLHSTPTPTPTSGPTSGFNFAADDVYAGLPQAARRGLLSPAAASLAQAGGEDPGDAGPGDQSPVPNAQGDLSTVLGYMGAHFMHNQVQLALLLPDTLRFPEAALGFLAHRDPVRFSEECCSTINYVRRLPFWFDVPQTGFDLPTQTIVLLALNLFLLALGITRAWQRWSWVGLMPLAVALAYTTITALARTSGGRYLLGVDWVALLYYALGVSQLALWGIKALTTWRVPESWLASSGPDQPAAARPTWNWAVPFALLMLLAIALPLSENLAPKRYTQARLDTMLSALLKAGGPDELDAPAVAAFMDSGGLVLPGRALYPRFYAEDRGAPGKPSTDRWAGMAKPTFYALPFNRMLFYLVGPENLTVLLRTKVPSADFPNAADVLVFGCPTDAYLDARLVGIFEDDGSLIAVYLGDETGPLTCASNP
ncbi:MAG: hypothetical protein ACK2UW_13440 [Anaerolineales bacterium]